MAILENEERQRVYFNDSFMGQYKYATAMLHNFSLGEITNGMRAVGTILYACEKIAPKWSVKQNVWNSPLSGEGCCSNSSTN